MACIYGRSIESLSKKESLTDDEKKKVEAWKKQAMTDLAESFNKGFSDLKWAQEDPDLKSLQELPKFKSEIEKRTKAQGKPPANGPQPKAPAVQQAVPFQIGG